MIEDKPKKENTRKKLAEKTISLRRLIFFWLVVVVLPMLFGKVILKSYFTEEEQRQKILLKKQLKQASQNIVNNLDSTYFLQNKLANVEKLLNLTNDKKYVSNSNFFSENSIENCAQQLWEKTTNLVGTAPILLMAYECRKERFKVLCQDEFFSGFSVPGRMATKTIFKNLLTPPQKQNKRFNQVFNRIFGKHAHFPGVPDKVHKIFSEKFDGGGLLLYYKLFPNSQNDNKAKNGYLICFKNSNIDQKEILKNAYANSRYSSFNKQIVLRNTNSKIGNIEKNNILEHHTPLPYKFIKMGSFQGKDIARKYIKSGILTIKKNNYLFLKLSAKFNNKRRIRNESIFSLLIFLIASISLIFFKSLADEKHLKLNIRTKLILGFMLAMMLPFAILVYISNIFKDFQIQKTTSFAQESLENNLSQYELQLINFEQKMRQNLRKLSQKFRQNRNKSSEDLKRTLAQNTQNLIDSYILFRSDGTLVYKFNEKPVNHSKLTANELLNMRIFSSFFLKSLDSCGIKTLDLEKKLEKQIGYPRYFCKLIERTDINHFLKNKEEVFEIKNKKSDDLKYIKFIIFPEENEPDKDFIIFIAIQNLRKTAQSFLETIAPSLLIKRIEGIETFSRSAFFIINSQLHGNTELLRSFPQSAISDAPLHYAAKKSTRENAYGQWSEKAENGVPQIFCSKRIYGFPLISVSYISLPELIKFDAKLNTFLLILLTYLLIVLGLTSTVISQAFIQPISKIISGTQLLEEGLFPNLKTNLKNELGKLIQSFNEMSLKLKERSLLDRFISKAAKETVIAEKNLARISTGKKIQTTVLFSHIKNFQQICETNKPENVIKIVNKFFSKMEPIVNANKGFVDKYIGDAIMAIFIDSKENTHPEKNACKCALEFMEKLAALNSDLKELNILPIQIGIGISSGPVISGRVGSRIGRMDFTVIGDTVNLAARLESLTSQIEEKIIVSKSVRDKTEAFFDFTSHGKVKIKGKEKPVQAFKLEGMA